MPLSPDIIGICPSADPGAGHVLQPGHAAAGGGLGGNLSAVGGFLRPGRSGCLRETVAERAIAVGHLGAIYLTFRWQNVCHIFI